MTIELSRTSGNSATSNNLYADVGVGVSWIASAFSWIDFSAAVGLAMTVELSWTSGGSATFNCHCEANDC
ncbi:MAG: hypothetical protein FWC76_01100 [Defluviitaleaceae bacterium]|nr:hypothetical protein [Defluviitaleaceae bacterium]